MKKKTIFTSVMALLFAGSAMAQTNATSITDGGYYRMYVPKSSVSLYANGNYLQKTQAAEGDNTDVFQFNESSTTNSSDSYTNYTIKCVGTGKYLNGWKNGNLNGATNKDWVQFANTESEWQVGQFTDNEVNYWIIGENGKEQSAEGWLNYNESKGKGGAVLKWKVTNNNVTDENSLFYLYPLTEYKVTVSGVNDESSIAVTVEDGSRKSTMTNGKVYLENTPTESTVCTVSEGYKVNKVSVSGTEITVEVEKDEYKYFAPESAVNRAIQSGGYYITQKNKGTNIYYAGFLDSNLRTIGGYSSKSGDELPNLNWTFTITPVDANDKSQGVKITTTDGYLCSKGYVKVGNEPEVLYFIKESDNAETFAITSDKINFWTKKDYEWDPTNKVNFIKTSTIPDYSFTLEDVVLKYYDGTTKSETGYTFETSDQNICAVIARVCNTESWYTMCLPFAVNDVNTTFGSGSTAATLDSFADNVFKFKSTTTIAANTPFILKPGRGTSELTTSQVSGKYTAYSVNGTKEVASSDPKTSATGATFTGVYQSGYVPEGSYFIGEGNKFYHASGTTNTIDPFRAYLTIDSSEKSKSIGFEIDGETTDIRFINNQPVNVEDGVITDLSGRRVKNPSKGVYIMNNKKVIIK